MTDPTPGSDTARNRGCKCPVMDNARGRGAWGTSGKDAVFWINADCPLHGEDRCACGQPATTTHAGIPTCGDDR